MDQKKAAMYAACATAVVFLGMLLPWWSVSFSGSIINVAGMSSSMNGFQIDMGTFIFILCLVGGGAAALIWKGKTEGLPLNAKQLSLVALGGFGVGALLTLIEIFRLSGSGFATMGRLGASAGKGFGIYLTLLGAGAGAYCAWVLFQKTPGAVSTPSAPSAPPPAAPPPA